MPDQYAWPGKIIRAQAQSQQIRAEPMDIMEVSKAKDDFVLLRGATQYPIWRSNTLVPPEGLSLRGTSVPSPNSRIEEERVVAEFNMPRHLRGTEASPYDTSSCSDRALAAVADAAAIVLPTNGTQAADASAAQVHFDRSALKLATAIKSLADGIHTLEHRQNDADTILRSLKESMRSVEETTSRMKIEQLDLMAAAKKALRTSKQQSEFLEFDRCIDPRSRVGSLPSNVDASACEARLQELERKVAALMQWQEDEATDHLSYGKTKPHGRQIVAQSSSGQSLSDTAYKLQLQASARQNQLMQSNCGFIKALDERVSHLEDSANSKVSDAANEIQFLFHHIQENYCSRQQLDHLLATGEAPRLQGSPRQTGALSGVDARMERIEARFDKSLADLSDRLDPIQDLVEHQRLHAWQADKQVPEVEQKLDHLWAQCQHYFSKVKEHDVHFGFFRTSFESHKQQCLDLDAETFASPSRFRSPESSIFPSTWPVRTEEGDLNTRAADQVEGGEI